MKLATAQFAMDNVNDFRTVLEAFVAPFPSLENLPGVAGELIEFLFAGEFSQKIQDAINEASRDGEWPGQVYLSGTKAGDNWKIDEMFIVPYVGDRFLIVRDFRDAPVWPTIFCQTDYSNRPSEVAAREVVALIENGSIFKWNDPQWAEMEPAA